MIDRWHKEILSDPGYIVVMPFLWQSGYIDGPNNPPANGTVDLPIVETRLRQFAHSVLSPDSSLYPVDYHASATTSNTLPFYAFDEDASTMWNAGAFPEAWIFADFGGSTRVKSIALKVAQYPAGRTTHVIEGCQLEADDCLLEQGCTCKGGWSTLVSSTAYTRDGGILSWQLNADLSRIRVRTTLSPSWVAWKGIRFSQ